ncbi:hypothetical protein VSPL_50410 [Vibrio splendidus]|nr:hypothetical protein VSPL_50410 [Vibrio splendidus]
MNKFLIVALSAAASISGCKSIPNSATDTLSEPQGNGATWIPPVVKHPLNLC